MKCSNCGADLNFEFKQETPIAYCPYCGNKIPVGEYKIEKKIIDGKMDIHYTDTVKLERERRKERKEIQERKDMKWYLLAVFVLLIMAYIVYRS